MKIKSLSCPICGADRLVGDSPDFDDDDRERAQMGYQGPVIDWAKVKLRELEAECQYDQSLVH